MMYVAHVNKAIAMAWMIQDTVVNEDQAYMNMLAGNRIAEKHAQCKRASGPRVGKYFLYSISWCTFDKKPRRVPIIIAAKMSPVSPTLNPWRVMKTPLIDWIKQYTIPQANPIHILQLNTTGSVNIKKIDRVQDM